MQEGEAPGTQLFTAVVRVIPHLDIEAAGVEGREAGELEGAGLQLQGSAGREGEVFGQGDFRVGVLDIQGDAFAGLVALGAGAHLDAGGALGILGLHGKVDELVSLGGEFHLLGRGTGEGHGTFGLDGDFGLVHVVFHGEHVHRNGHLFTAAQHARQGGHQHERILHGNGLFRIAEGAVVTGDQHHAHAAHVHGKLEFEDVRALQEGLGRKGEHHRVEAVVLAGIAHGILVTADGGQRREAAAEGADHLVVEVPGVYAQGFAAVHLGPRVRSLEGGEVQQAFVHDGQGIGHGLAALLGHLYGEFFFRTDNLGKAQDRLQMAFRVLHQDALHAVQAQRKVVHGRAVRLQERHMHIDIGRHGRLHGEAPGRVFLSGAHPFAADNAGSVLQRNQGLSALGGGNEYGGRLAGFVLLLVGGEAEHGEGFGILAACAALIVSPVGGERASAHVAGLLVAHQDEVSAPFLVAHLEGDDAVLRTGSEGAGEDGLHGVAAHVGVQVAAGVVPPPVPAGLEHAVFHLVALEALALGTHYRNAEAVLLAGFQVVSLGKTDAHIGAEGREGNGLRGETFVSAGLCHGGDDKGSEHARGLFGIRKHHPGAALAVRIQRGLVQLVFGLGEVGRRVVEAVVLEVLEGTAVGLPEGHVGPCGTAGSRSAGEPGGRYGEGDRLAGFQHGRILRVHLEAVGLDGLDVQGLVEAAAAHLHIGVPVTGGIAVAGGDVEAVETVGAFPHQAGIELPFGSIDFQGGGMAFRKGAALVRKDHGQVYRVAGTPYAALSVQEGLDALLQGFAAHVEAAQGTLVAAHHLQVGGAAAGLGHDGKRLVREVQRNHAVLVGLALADALELEVKDFDIGPGGGLGRDEVGGGDPDFLAAGIFRHEAQVAGHQLHGREAVAVHVVGRLGGIVGFFPIVGFPVVVVVPVVGRGFVPDGLILGRGLSISGRRAQEGLPAAVQALVQAETEADAVDGAGLFFQETAQVDAVLVPLVEVFGSVQGDVSLIDQASAAAEAAAAAQVVVLQEHQDVLLINFHNAHFHGVQVHRPEGEDELVLVGEDVAVYEEFHGRRVFLQGKDAGPLLSKGFAFGILQGGVQRELHVGVTAFEEHIHLFSIGLDVVARVAGEFHHAFLVGVHGRFTEYKADMVTLQLATHHMEAILLHLGLGLGGGLFAALHRDGEVEGLGSAAHHLSEEEGDIVGGSYLESPLFRNEGEAGRGTPEGVPLEGRRDFEEFLGIRKRAVLQGGDIFCELQLNHGVIGHDAAGVRLDVRGKLLCRRSLGLFFGPAGHQGDKSSRQKKDFTHFYSFQNRQ